MFSNKVPHAALLRYYENAVAFAKDSSNSARAPVDDTSDLLATSDDPAIIAFESDIGSLNKQLQALSLARSNLFAERDWTEDVVRQQVALEKQMSNVRSDVEKARRAIDLRQCVLWLREHANHMNSTVYRQTYGDFVLLNSDDLNAILQTIDTHLTTCSTIADDFTSRLEASAAFHGAESLTASNIEESKKQLYIQSKLLAKLKATRKNIFELLDKPFVGDGSVAANDAYSTHSKAANKLIRQWERHVLVNIFTRCLSRIPASDVPHGMKMIPLDIPSRLFDSLLDKDTLSQFEENVVSMHYHIMRKKAAAKAKQEKADALRELSDNFASNKTTYRNTILKIVMLMGLGTKASEEMTSDFEQMRIRFDNPPADYVSAARNFRKIWYGDMKSFVEPAKGALLPYTKPYSQLDVDQLKQVIVAELPALCEYCAHTIFHHDSLYSVNSARAVVDMLHWLLVCQKATTWDDVLGDVAKRQLTSHIVRQPFLPYFSKTYLFLALYTNVTPFGFAMKYLDDYQFWEAHQKLLNLLYHVVLQEDI